MMNWWIYTYTMILTIKLIFNIPWSYKTNRRPLFFATVITLVFWSARPPARRKLEEIIFLQPSPSQLFFNFKIYWLKEGHTQSMLRTYYTQHRHHSSFEFASLLRKPPSLNLLIAPWNICTLLYWRYVAGAIASWFGSSQSFPAFPVNELFR